MERGKKRLCITSYPKFAKEFLKRKILWTQSPYKVKIPALQLMAKSFNLDVHTRTMLFWCCKFRKQCERKVLGYLEASIQNNANIDLALKSQKVPQWIRDVDEKLQLLPKMIQRLLCNGLLPPKHKEQVVWNKFVVKLLRHCRRYKTTPNQDVVVKVADLMDLKNHQCLQRLWNRQEETAIYKYHILAQMGDKPRDDQALTRVEWAVVDFKCLHCDFQLVSDHTFKSDEQVTALMDLYFLVKIYKIEEKSGEDVKEKWAKVVRNYSRKYETSSSGIVLQHRWCDLKNLSSEHIRKRMHDKEHKVHALLVEIASTYPHILRGQGKPHFVDVSQIVPDVAYCSDEERNEITNEPLDKTDDASTDFDSDDEKPLVVVENKPAKCKEPLTKMDMPDLEPLAYDNLKKSDVKPDVDLNSANVERRKMTEVTNLHDDLNNQLNYLTDAQLSVVPCIDYDEKGKDTIIKTFSKVSPVVPVAPVNDTVINKEDIQSEFETLESEFDKHLKELKKLNFDPGKRENVTTNKKENSIIQKKKAVSNRNKYGHNSGLKSKKVTPPHITKDTNLPVKTNVIRGIGSKIYDSLNKNKAPDPQNNYQDSDIDLLQKIDPKNAETTIIFSDSENEDIISNTAGKDQTNNVFNLSDVKKYLSDHSLDDILNKMDDIVVKQDVDKSRVCETFVHLSDSDDETKFPTNISAVDMNDFKPLGEENKSNLDLSIEESDLVLYEVLSRSNKLNTIKPNRTFFKSTDLDNSHINIDKNVNHLRNISYNAKNVLKEYEKIHENTNIDENASNNQVEGLNLLRSLDKSNEKTLGANAKNANELNVDTTDNLEKYRGECETSKKGGSNNICMTSGSNLKESCEESKMCNDFNNTDLEMGDKNYEDDKEINENAIDPKLIMDTRIYLPKIDEVDAYKKNRRIDYSINTRRISKVGYKIINYKRKSDDPIHINNDSQSIISDTMKNTFSNKNIPEKRMKNISDVEPGICTSRPNFADLKTKIICDLVVKKEKDSQETIRNNFKTSKVTNIGHKIKFEEDSVSDGDKMNVKAEHESGSDSDGSINKEDFASILTDGDINKTYNERNSYKNHLNKESNYDSEGSRDMELDTIKNNTTHVKTADSDSPNGGITNNCIKNNVINSSNLQRTDIYRIPENETSSNNCLLELLLRDKNSSSNKTNKDTQIDENNIQTTQVIENITKELNEVNHKPIEIRKIKTDTNDWTGNNKNTDEEFKNGAENITLTDNYYEDVNFKSVKRKLNKNEEHNKNIDKNKTFEKYYNIIDTDESTDEDIGTKTLKKLKTTYTEKDYELLIENQHNSDDENDFNCDRVHEITPISNIDDMLKLCKPVKLCLEKVKVPLETNPVRRVELPDRGSLRRHRAPTAHVAPLTTTTLTTSFTTTTNSLTNSFTTSLTTNDTTTLTSFTNSLTTSLTTSFTTSLTTSLTTSFTTTTNSLTNAFTTTNTTPACAQDLEVMEGEIENVLQELSIETANEWQRLQGAVDTSFKKRAKSPCTAYCPLKEKKKGRYKEKSVTEHKKRRLTITPEDLQSQNEEWQRQKTMNNRFFDLTPIYKRVPSHSKTISEQKQALLHKKTDKDGSDVKNQEIITIDDDSNSNSDNREIVTLSEEGRAEVDNVFVDNSNAPFYVIFQSDNSGMLVQAPELTPLTKLNVRAADKLKTKRDEANIKTIRVKINSQTNSSSRSLLMPSVTSTNSFGATLSRKPKKIMRSKKHTNGNKSNIDGPSKKVKRNSRKKRKFEDVISLSDSDEEVKLDTREKDGSDKLETVVNKSKKGASLKKQQYNPPIKVMRTNPEVNPKPNSKNNLKVMEIGPMVANMINVLTKKSQTLKNVPQIKHVTSVPISIDLDDSSDEVKSNDDSNSNDKDSNIDTERASQIVKVQSVLGTNCDTSLSKEDVNLNKPVNSGDEYVDSDNDDLYIDDGINCSEDSVTSQNSELINDSSGKRLEIGPQIANVFSIPSISRDEDLTLDRIVIDNADTKNQSDSKFEDSFDNLKKADEENKLINIKIDHINHSKINDSNETDNFDVNTNNVIPNEKDSITNANTDVNNTKVKTDQENYTRNDDTKVKSEPKSFLKLVPIKKLLGEPHKDIFLDDNDDGSKPRGAPMPFMCSTHETGFPVISDIRSLSAEETSQCSKSTEKSHISSNQIPVQLESTSRQENKPDLQANGIMRDQFSSRAVSVSEFIADRDVTNLTLLCVDGARPLWKISADHLIVTNLKLPIINPTYWTLGPVEETFRIIIDDDSNAGSSAVGGVTIPDDIFVDRHWFRKLCADPLVYSKIWFAVHDNQSFQHLLLLKVPVHVYSRLTGKVLPLPVLHNVTGRMDDKIKVQNPSSVGVMVKRVEDKSFVVAVADSDEE